MKKSTKTVTTPAKPAPSPVKKKTEAKAQPAAAPASKKPAKKATPVAAVRESAPAAPAASPAAKTPALSEVPTVITAKIDVGFGNTLYIRGEGPGLSWESGKVLDCISDDEWSIKFTSLERPVVFKFLLNDLTWCTGEDFVVTPGSSLTVTPTF